MLAVFEDDSFESFYPLSLTRPVFELKCGATSLCDKILRSFPGQTASFFTRDYLSEGLRGRRKAPVNELSALSGSGLLLVNGRWLMNDFRPEPEGSDEAGYADDSGELLYVRLSGDTLKKIKPAGIDDIIGHASRVDSKKEVSGQKLIKYPWDLLANNSGAIEDDFERSDKGIFSELPPGASIVGEKSRVRIAPNVRIYPNVVIDSSAGPVTVEEGAVLYPNTWIQGPAYIGRNTIVYGAKIRSGVSAGEECRLGGEIEETIIHGFANKYHDGFLGHSYLGEFVNIGAGTITSDLKLDYSETEVYMKGGFIPTGQKKVGVFMGDHSKTGISTLLNTASSVGVLCFVLGAGSVAPRYIPSFSWYVKKKLSPGFGFDRMIEAASAQMRRRGRDLSETDLLILEKAYEITASEREKQIAGRA